MAGFIFYCDYKIKGIYWFWTAYARPYHWENNLQFDLFFLFINVTNIQHNPLNWLLVMHNDNFNEFQLLAVATHK